VRKEELREEFKRRRAGLDSSWIREKSLQVKENLLKLPEFQRASTVAIYLPKSGSGEVDTSLLLDQLGEKRILAPVIIGERIEFAPLQSPFELEPGPFGIPQPKSRNFLPCSEIDLVLVPGICFDFRGRRLGYGKGFYDGFLKKLRSENPRAIAVGLAYSFQVLEELPESPNDEKVDIIVTEEGVIHVRVRP
jgi:5-formyltetrahydrofolate cyclo-ligase